jgi:hypothetical protein
MRLFFTIGIIAIVALAALPVITDAEEQLKVVGLNDGLRIAADELPILKAKAKRGNQEAALKLATYYGIYLNDKKRQMEYYKLAAKSGSIIAVENLVTTYSTDNESFDFAKALRWRRRLKEMAQQKNVKIESDAEWGYGLYLNHLTDKDHGLFFLKYAAKHGSAKARQELSESFPNQ